MTRSRLAAVLILIIGACASLAVVPLVAHVARGPGAGPAGLDGEGGTIAWTLDVESGAHDAWVFGDTAVILDGTSLVGVRRGDGGRVWQLPYPDDDTTLTAAGGMAVVQRGTDGPVDVIAPATGRTAWSTPAAVRLVARDDALYLDSCPDRRVPAPRCVTEKRRVTDGETLWTVENAGYVLGTDVIGGRRPLAPAPSAYLPVTTTGDGPLEGALADTATGRLLPGRIEPRAWHVLAAGDTLVATDHDPASGDRDCTVAVDAVHGPTGRPAWTGAIYSGREADGECTKSFSRIYSGGPELFGAGGDVAAVTPGGRTTLVDLATGGTRWTADRPGFPLANDPTTLLVRDNAETGPIALLDLATGRRLWDAPDTGLPATSASWAAVVAGDLIAVMGATGDRPYVLIYDTATGRQLARRGGWLTGVGDDWAMVSTGAGASPGRLTLHMLTF